MLAYWAIGVAALANGAASIVLKRAGVGATGLGTYVSPWFFLALALFGLNLVAYTYAVRTVPLYAAYSLLVSGTLVVVSLYAFLGMGETVTLSRLFGMVLITMGVALVVR